MDRGGPCNFWSHSQVGGLLGWFELPPLQDAARIRLEGNAL